MKNIKLSYSGLEKYKTCPRLYKLHYIDKIRSTRKSSALLFGSALDEALNVLLEEKNLDKAVSTFKGIMIKWKHDFTVDFFKSDYDANILTESDKKSLEQVEDDHLEHIGTWLSLNRKGLMLLNKYNEDVIPNIHEVVSVQREIKKTNQHGDTIIGYLDLVAKIDIDGEILETIIDNKTSSKSYSKRMIETSRQLALYSWALNIPNISYFVMRKDLNTKSEVRPIQILKDVVRSELVEEVLLEFDQVLDGIKNEEFEPTKDMNCCKFMFGKKCPYFDLCHNNKTVEECTNLEVK